MKGILAIALIVAAAAYAQDDGVGGIVTPGGLRITPQRMYVNAKHDETGEKSKWHDSELAFTHGNAALRLHLANTNDVAMKLRAQLPLEVGAHMIILAARKEVAAGEEVELDIPVPAVGNVGICRTDVLDTSRTRITDGIGEERVTPSIVSFGYTTGGYEKSIYQPVGGNVASDAAGLSDAAPDVNIAISPAVERFNLVAEWERFMKERQGNSPDGERSRLRTESPDFKRFRRWQDLSVYDMIVIDEDDWAVYPKSLKEILPDWVAAGGILALVGTEQPPITPGNCGLGRVVALGASAPDFDALFKTLAGMMIRYSLATSPFECDIKASDAVGALRNETPFSTILMVLLAFCVLAGPVLVFTLARRNRRLSLLWLFPIMSVVFSLGVMGVIVFSKGTDPELRQFVHTIFDEKAGKVVTICNHVILAPFTLQGDVKLDARDSVVSYMSGDANRCGETIIYNGKEFVFRDGWAPTLWPVVFRSISVRPISDAPSAPPIPISGRLQEHYVSATEERRAAK